MAWVRIDDSAMGNLKIVRIPDSAFRLWVKGLCYCQTHLTDGLIPREALGPMEAKRKDVDALCKVWVEGKSALWQTVEGFGFKVHDYFDYNDSRDEALARKNADRERKRKSRGFQAESAAPSERTAVSRPTGVPLGGVRSFGSREIQEAPTDEIGDRAAALLERFGELYSELRRGAKYLRTKPVLEWPLACEMCRTWDDAHLEKLMRIFLTTDEQWISSTGRGFKVFTERASWCDDRLREWEAKQKATA